MKKLKKHVGFGFPFQWTFPGFGTCKYIMLVAVFGISLDYTFYYTILDAKCLRELNFVLECYFFPDKWCVLDIFFFLWHKWVALHLANGENIWILPSILYLPWFRFSSCLNSRNLLNWRMWASPESLRMRQMCLLSVEMCASHLATNIS